MAPLEQPEPEQLQPKQQVLSRLPMSKELLRLHDMVEFLAAENKVLRERKATDTLMDEMQQLRQQVDEMANELDEAHCEIAMLKQGKTVCHKSKAWWQAKRDHATNAYGSKLQRSTS